MDDLPLLTRPDLLKNLELRAYQISRTSNIPCGISLIPGEDRWKMDNFYHKKAVSYKLYILRYE